MNGEWWMKLLVSQETVNGKRKSVEKEGRRQVADDMMTEPEV